MTTEVNQYTMEDLDYFWMSDGIPMFIADRPDICDIVESIGFNIYYLLIKINDHLKYVIFIYFSTYFQVITLICNARYISK